MGSMSRKARITVLGVLAAVVVLVPTGSASAATLDGIWGPFTRCPVDSPTLLAADGVSADPACIASSSPSGSIKLGNSTATTGRTDLQLGAVIADADASFSLVSPAGGGIVADPVAIPGGLLGLMCPSDIPAVSLLCATITDGSANRVTATVVPAGEPSNFNLGAGLTTGVPIVTLPVRIKLANPLLAPGCTIGTDSDPIVLRPENTTTPSITLGLGDLDGTPNEMGALVNITGVSTQGDDSFAAPGATGCGLAGLVDLAINAKVGLPSPAGNNSLVLNNGASSVIAEANQGPVTGQQFSDGWHAALRP
jgi:hypothetical protein